MTALALLVAGFLGAQLPVTEKYLRVEYCELIRNPAQYDGKKVEVRASYRYGWEWAEIFCLECREIGLTWLETDPNADDTSFKALNKALKRAPKYLGTVNATFFGTFLSSWGQYGYDGRYRYCLVAEKITSVVVVSKSGTDPRNLPQKVRQRLCQK